MSLDEMIEAEFTLEKEYEEEILSAKKIPPKKKPFSNQSYFTQKQIEINSLPETRLINITKLFLFHFGLLDIRNSTEFTNKVIENKKSYKHLFNLKDNFPRELQRTLGLPS